MTLQGSPSVRAEIIKTLKPGVPYAEPRSSNFKLSRPESTYDKILKNRNTKRQEDSDSGFNGVDHKGLKTEVEKDSVTDNSLYLKADDGEDKMFEYDNLSVISEQPSNIVDNESMLYKGDSETSSIKSGYYYVDESSTLKDTFIFDRKDSKIPRSRSQLSLQSNKSNGKSRNYMNKRSKSQLSLDASILSEPIKEESTYNSNKVYFKQNTSDENKSPVDQKETFLFGNSQPSNKPIVAGESYNKSEIEKLESPRLPLPKTDNHLPGSPISLTGSNESLSSSRRDSETVVSTVSNTQFDSQIENQSLSEETNNSGDKEKPLPHKQVTFSKSLEDNLDKSEDNLNKALASGKQYRVHRSRLENLVSMAPKDTPNEYDEDYCNIVVYEDASSFDTVMEQINKVMEEIKQQRSQFKSELEEITSNLRGKHLCSCEGSLSNSIQTGSRMHTPGGRLQTPSKIMSQSYQVHRRSGRTRSPQKNTSAPFQRTGHRSYHKQMSEQEAAKPEVKEEAEKKVDTKNDEEQKENIKSPDKSTSSDKSASPEKSASPDKSDKSEVKKENKENQGPGSATPEGTLSPEPAAANGEAPGTPTKLPTLREQFGAFSKFGDTKSDGKLITLSQSDKWFKQAKVIDGKKGSITTTDTSICFSKLKAKKISIADFNKYLEDLAKSKKMEAKDIKEKLRSCGAPGTSGTTPVAKTSAVDRLTDTKKYTGSHKLRRGSPKAKSSKE